MGYLKKRTLFYTKECLFKYPICITFICYFFTALNWFLTCFFMIFFWECRCQFKTLNKASSVVTILNMLHHLAVKVGDVTTATQMVWVVVELHLLV